MNAWALLTAGVLIGLCGTGAIAAAAVRNRNGAVGLATACAALALPVGLYVHGWRGVVAHVDHIAAVRIITRKAITDRVKPALPPAVAPPTLASPVKADPGMGGTP
jgi:hypothetical protein